MSLYSTNPKERLFHFSNTNNINGNLYTESFYYLINTYEYDKGILYSVSFKIVIFVEEYFKGNILSSDYTVKSPNIPKWLEESVLAYKNLGGT